MKEFSAIVILLFTMISWSSNTTNHTSSTSKNNIDSLKQRIQIFNQELEDHIIEPNVIMNVDSSSVSFSNFKIDHYNDDNGLVIKVNDDEIKTYYCLGSKRFGSICQSNFSD